VGVSVLTGEGGTHRTNKRQAPRVIGSVLELTHPRAQRFGKQEEPETRERLRRATLTQLIEA
jgi:hypothetical protein